MQRIASVEHYAAQMSRKGRSIQSDEALVRINICCCPHKRQWRPQMSANIHSIIAAA